jgi:hypothetical protein
LRFASTWSNHAANSAGVKPTRYIVGSIMIWATSNVAGLPASQLAICSITQNATMKPTGGATAAKIKKRFMRGTLGYRLNCGLAHTVAPRHSLRRDAKHAGRHRRVREPLPRWKAGDLAPARPVDNPKAAAAASKQAAMVCYRHTGLINDGQNTCGSPWSVPAISA